MTIFLTNVNTHGKCCFRDFLFATLFLRLFIYIVLSLRQRILTHRGLRRRHYPSDIDAVLQAVGTVVTESLVILECGKDYYKVIILLLAKKLFVMC